MFWGVPQSIKQTQFPVQARGVGGGFSSASHSPSGASPPNSPPPFLFYSRAIARRGRKQWLLAWACVTTASCTTVITPSPPPSLRLSCCISQGGETAPERAWLGPRRWRGGMGLWKAWPFLLLASALCCYSEVSKLYAKGQTVNSSGVSGRTASVTAQLCHCSSKKLQAMCKQMAAAGCQGNFAVATVFLVMRCISFASLSVSFPAFSG